MSPPTGGDPVLALIFDFDDTLAPDSTTSFLESKGIDSKEIWTKEAPALAAAGYDSTLAWLKLFLDRVGPGAPLGPVSNDELRVFGATLGRTFYPGLPDFFDDIRARAAEVLPTVRVEFYIISSGLLPIIEGSEIVKKYIRGVYASELDEDEQGVVRHT